MNDFNISREAEYIKSIISGLYNCVFLSARFLYVIVKT